MCFPPITRNVLLILLSGNLHPTTYNLSNAVIVKIFETCVSPPMGQPPCRLNWTCSYISPLVPGQLISIVSNRVPYATKLPNGNVKA